MPYNPDTSQNPCNLDGLWSCLGNADWFTQTDNTCTSATAWQAGDINDDETSKLEVTLTLTAPGSFTFDYGVDSESGYDYLRFYIDDVLQMEDSGSVACTTYTDTLGAGTYTFRWSYEKDNIVSEGQDTAWIANISFNDADDPSSVSSSSTSNSTPNDLSSLSSNTPSSQSSSSSSSDSTQSSSSSTSSTSTSSSDSTQTSSTSSTSETSTSSTATSSSSSSNSSSSDSTQSPSSNSSSSISQDSNSSVSSSSQSLQSLSTESSSSDSTQSINDESSSSDSTQSLSSASTQSESFQSHSSESSSSQSTFSESSESTQSSTSVSSSSSSESPIHVYPPKDPEACKLFDFKSFCLGPYSLPTEIQSRVYNALASDNVALAAGVDPLIWKNPSTQRIYYEHQERLQTKAQLPFCVYSIKRMGLAKTGTGQHQTGPAETEVHLTLHWPKNVACSYSNPATHFLALQTWHLVAFRQIRGTDHLFLGDQEFGEIQVEQHYYTLTSVIRFSHLWCAEDMTVKALGTCGGLTVPPFNDRRRTLTFGFGPTIAVGASQNIFLPWTAKIISWHLTAQSVGDIEIDLQVREDGNLPTAANSIVNTDVPELVGAQGDFQENPVWDYEVLAANWRVRAEVLSVNSISNATLVITFQVF